MKKILHNWTILTYVYQSKPRSFLVTFLKMKIYSESFKPEVTLFQLLAEDGS